MRVPIALLAAITAGCTGSTPARSPTVAMAPPGAPPIAHRPPDEPDGPITASDRVQLIDALTAELARNYVFADKATQIGAALHDHLRRGDYDTIARGQAFADRVTEDMAAVVHDKHLGVHYSARSIEPFDEHLPPELAAEEAAEQLYLNHGIFDVRRMRFNLGYLVLAAFGRPEQTADKLASAMRLLHDTQSLIIDLRECHGGDPETVTLAESYLVPGNTHLIDLYTRATNETERVYAKTELGGPRYAADKPVFVLVGDHTGSGCEAFAYAMQAQKRATVIGVHTAGAAYFGDPHRVTEHFMAFIPIGRPIDPITHGDWEGTGVIPSIVVTDLAKALDVAERSCLELARPHERSDRRKADMAKRIAELADPRPTARPDR